MPCWMAAADVEPHTCQCRACALRTTVAPKRGPWSCGPGPAAALLRAPPSTCFSIFKAAFHLCCFSSLLRRYGTRALEQLRRYFEGEIADVMSDDEEGAAANGGAAPAGNRSSNGPADVAQGEQHRWRG